MAVTKNGYPKQSYVKPGGKNSRRVKRKPERGKHGNKMRTYDKPRKKVQRRKKPGKSISRAPIMRFPGVKV